MNLRQPYLVGPISRSANRDEIGHREYTVNWHVRTQYVHDGPAYILNNWPLPAVGSVYNLLAWYPESTDLDLWAFCTPELNIAPKEGVREGDPHQDWIITQKWTTNPKWRCQTFPIENPLLEPFKLSGDFIHEQRLAAFDRFGNPLRYPNWEPITGPLTERKYSYPTIKITFNSATLPLSTYTLLINKVNDAPLWGLPARCVRFQDASWQRLVYGTCFYYFETSYTFEIDIGDETYTGFDRPIPAFGSKVLKDGGDRNNPEHFVPAKSDGENVEVPLTWEGKAATAAVYQHIMKPQIHHQGNLLLLGIPSSLN